MRSPGFNLPRALGEGAPAPAAEIAVQRHLDLRRAAPPRKPRRDDARVVHDQHIAAPQQVGQVAHRPVGEPVAHDEQARRVARLGRPVARSGRAAGQNRTPRRAWASLNPARAGRKAPGWTNKRRRPIFNLMDCQAIEPWTHGHVFLGADHAKNARKTRAVIWLCAATMVAEIVGGAWFHSVAVVADGLHMGTHVSALAIAAFAYFYASRHARDENFTFGTGKVGDLAVFSSAIVLAIVALFIAGESIEHLLSPPRIAFREAIPLAALGLAVNLLSAFLLRDDHHGHDHGHDHAHDHDHDHAHDQDHDHAHHDLNLRAAYIHVLADAGVSVLALIGLTAGLVLGWIWMDAAMGLVGAAVIANWAWSLVRAAGRRCSTGDRNRLCTPMSWRGWSKRATASPICIYGASARATSPPPSRCAAPGRNRPITTSTGSRG